ncbi:MAG: S8 family serine peptidase [Bacteriovoracaceae bacterium]|nr:S8 family serine peptidase [Bacteriovoracaceae bacterium]
MNCQPKITKVYSFVIFLLTVFFTSQLQAYTEIVNPSELKKRLGNISASRNLSNIKVAVLDNGFAGFVAGSGMLPDSAEYIEGPLKTQSNSSHGLGMAQILWAVTGKTATGPKIYLVNTNGFTNFKAAVDFVVKEEVDIVLYSQVWMFGSNFDGKGFINEVVNRATEAGIIWINAAGNLGAHVYTGSIGEKKKVFSFNNRLDENNFTVTLTWNDFAESEFECSAKDMDLEILNAKDEVVASSTFVQKGEAPDTKNQNDKRSCYARESVSLKLLERGVYRARITRKSEGFLPSDTFRIVISDEKPESIIFTDARVGQEIMPPADNAQVITIGDQSKLSAVGPTQDKRMKPDFVVMNSKVQFTNGNETSGSSNAAALVAGAVAVMKSHNSMLTWQKIQNYSESLRHNYMPSSGLKPFQNPPPLLANLIPENGSVMLHPATGRAVIFSREEPLDLSPLKYFDLVSLNEDDIFACKVDISDCDVFPKARENSLSAPWVEFRQFKKISKSKIPVWKTFLAE